MSQAVRYPLRITVDVEDDVGKSIDALRERASDLAPSRSAVIRAALRRGLAVMTQDFTGPTSKRKAL
jgi:Arc/MetJ-type ribon-helix-helix transcriptional regulator